MISAWHAQGLNVRELVAQPSAYPPAGRLARLAWAPQALADATHRVLRANAFDAVIVQRELISTLPSVEGLIRRPLIADVDDAIWLHRGGHAAHHLAKLATQFVVGNSYLAEHFSRYGKPVSVIPTAVDVQRFHPAPRSDATPRVIGWSGTSGGYRYFAPLQDALAALLRRHPDWRLRFISDRPPTLERLPAAQVEYHAWSQDTEAALTADMDIGIMPLDDSPWSLGKCSYKMLLYMACGIPVVVSDLGMNRDILGMREVGLGVRSPDDWVEALDALMGDEPCRQRMGREGRKLAVERFSLAVAASQWCEAVASLHAR
ncbi:MULTISPECIES: glycosyltransferase [unclassified Roseateles]|uniref:glycosyltransferase n=1 Tax=unclassified Roseateles TaxID=2626991 RepID=UPI000ADE31BA|nr:MULTISPECIES: glycosyltransferase [unclassified Roseateles]